MLFQSRCAGCERVGEPLCRRCRFALAAPSAMPQSEDVIAAVPFTGVARDVMLGFKYRNRRQLAGHLGGLLVNRLLSHDVNAGSVDVVTWAPTSRDRRNHRGFDQAELVARHVARQLGVPCRRLLDRSGSTAPQTGMARVERLHGPTYRVSPAAHGRRVLVVDDVVTTGSTLRAASAALRNAGAVAVQRAAVATTPALGRPASSPRPRPVLQVVAATHIGQAA